MDWACGCDRRDRKACRDVRYYSAASSVRHTLVESIINIHHKA
jgi:hypothetical protein